MDLGRAFVGERDGDAFAADVVEVDMVFLLNALAEVLHAHVFLGELDLERAAVRLGFRQLAALLAEGFLALADVRLLGLLLRQQGGGLGIDLLALVLERFDPGAGLLDLRFGLLFAGEEGGDLAAALLDDLGEFAHALVEGLALLAAGGQHLLLGGQGDLALGEAGRGLVPAQPQRLQS